MGRGVLGNGTRRGGLLHLKSQPLLRCSREGAQRPWGQEGSRRGGEGYYCISRAGPSLICCSLTPGCVMATNQAPPYMADPLYPLKLLIVKINQEIDFV